MSEGTVRCSTSSFLRSEYGELLYLFRNGITGVIEHFLNL
jgi:hypothetical protein